MTNEVKLTKKGLPVRRTTVNFSISIEDALVINTAYKKFENDISKKMFFSFVILGGIDRAISESEKICTRWQN